MVLDGFERNRSEQSDRARKTCGDLFSDKEIITEYNRKDFESYQELKARTRQSMHASQRNNRAVRDGGRNTSEDSNGSEVVLSNGRSYDPMLVKEFYDVLTQSTGYDGMIAEWKHKDGTSNVYVTFNSNQAKNITNTSPTDSPDIRYSESDIDKFTERTYNNYGWVSVNDVLSSQALRRMYSQFASIKTGVHYDKTIDGYYIIPTGDYDKVLNNFVYIKGTVKNPVIKQIIKLNLQSESEIYIAGMWLDEIRRDGLEQSERARKAIVDSYGEGSARICLPDDFKSFKDQIRSRKAGNLQANKRNTRAEQDGGRNDSKNQGRSEVDLSDEVKTSISDAGMRLTDDTELSSLMRDNADYKAEIERLKGEFVKSKRMGGKGKNRLVQADINRIAREIISGHSSEISFYDLKDELTGFYEFLANADVESSGDYAFMVKTANDLAENSFKSIFRKRLKTVIW